MWKAPNSVSWRSLYSPTPTTIFFPPPLIAAVQLHTFPQILVPFLLRRVKADVALNIPPKKELLVYAPMSPVQLELYRATVEHNYNKLLRKTEEVRQIKHSYCSCQLYHTYLLFLWSSEELEDYIITFFSFHHIFTRHSCKIMHNCVSYVRINTKG